MTLPIRFYFSQNAELSLLIGMEFSNVIYTSDPDKADVLILQKNELMGMPNIGGKIIVIPDLWHGLENGAGAYRKIETEILTLCDQSRLLILTQYHSFPDINFESKYTRLRKYDIMFNRHKAYFSQLPFKNLFLNHDIPWYWAGNRCYDIEQWSRKSEHRSKIFLSASRPYKNRIRSIRPQLNQLLDRYSDLGYLAKHASSTGGTPIKLFSRRDDPLVNGSLEFDVNENTIIDRSTYYTPIGDEMAIGFAPVHINYYENSFISIYGETIEYGNTVIVSEKTFNPLIQGHFILPFSSPYLIKAIQDMGFRMPDFIDYSYDEIKDDEKRKDAFFKEIERLLANPVTWWADQREKNLDLLFHNRQLFWHKSYDQFMPHVKELLNTL